MIEQSIKQKNDEVMKTNLKIFVVLISIVFTALLIAYSSNDFPTAETFPEVNPVLLRHVRNLVLLVFVILLLTIGNLYYTRKISENLDKIARSMAENQDQY